MTSHLSAQDATPSKIIYSEFYCQISNCVPSIRSQRTRFESMRFAFVDFFGRDIRKRHFAGGNFSAKFRAEYFDRLPAPSACAFTASFASCVTILTGPRLHPNALLPTAAAARIEQRRECLPSSEPNALLFPLIQKTPASRGRRIFWGGNRDADSACAPTDCPPSISGWVPVRHLGVKPCLRCLGSGNSEPTRCRCSSAIGPCHFFLTEAQDSNRLTRK
jgi:hypothetical protein